MGAWLVVGLGNPGPEYDWSPHNAGFLVVERLAERNNIRISRPDSQARIGVGSIRVSDGAEVPVVVAKPQTYMNRSGPSVKALLDKHEIPLERLLVVYDELDLPEKSLRIRPSGSPAGHNGMKSVVSSLGTQEFARLRVGVHPGHPLSSGADFLLEPMKKGQRKEWESLLDDAARAVESIIADGVEKAMTKFNRRAGGLNKEDQ
jgi:PTH1 family peptidyl-tRNA hydrolase